MPLEGESLLRDAVTRVYLLHANQDFSGKPENPDCRSQVHLLTNTHISGGDALRGHTRSHPEHDG